MRIIEFNKQDTLPQLSIVSLTFNAEDFVIDLIDSFFSQDVIKSCEIIIGDDASKDKTTDLITDKLKNSPCPARLIVRDKNVGPQTNWLESIYLAKSSLVAYVDGDDYYISPSKLSSDIKILKSDQKLNMIFGPAIKELDGNITSKHRNVYKNWDPDKIDIEWVLRRGGGFYPTSTVVFRKAIFNDLPDWFFTTHCTGDLPLALAALLNNGRIQYKPSIDCVYRVHKKSRTNSVLPIAKTFKKNTCKKNQNSDFYRLLMKNEFISYELCQDLLKKEEYIFFSKLLDVGAYDYCLKHSIKKLSIKYLVRLYVKFIWILTNKLFNNIFKFFKITNKSD